jgi:glycosyltransferase involved in cell wall biosynthesis
MAQKGQPPPSGTFVESTGSTMKNGQSRIGAPSGHSETDTMTNLTVTDSFRSLQAEVRQLREHVQMQARHNEVIEAQLANLQAKFSTGSEVVTIRDEIRPLLGSVCLSSTGDGEAPYQWVDPPRAKEVVSTDHDWWPTKRTACNYLVPNSGWQNHSIQGTTSLVIAFSMFGLNRTQMEGYVDQIRQQQSVNANFVPVFLTDSTCFDIFRRHGYVFEYFPSPEKRRTYNGSMDWETYANKRLDFLIRKWGVAKMIVFGERAILTDTPRDRRHGGSDLSAPEEPDRGIPLTEMESCAELGKGNAAASRHGAAAGDERNGRTKDRDVGRHSCSNAVSKPTANCEAGPFEATQSVKGVVPSARSHVVFYPDYRHANPYQTLLYGNLPSHFTSESGSIHDALKRQVAGGANANAIFHLHWEDAVIKNERSEAAAQAAAKAFIEALQLFRSRGGAVVWTVHNVASHDGLYPDVQEALCRDLSKIAHRVHFHSESAYRVASECFSPPEDHVRILHHGNYIDLIDTVEARDTVREALGYQSEECVFILFGRILRYKGGDDLLRAFSSLQARNAKLIIAGKILDPLPIEDLPKECRARIAVHQGRLAQADLSRLVRAADFSVLPYRRVLTSGSVLFSMSAGVPVIAPSLPSLRELVGDGRGGLLFEPGSWRALAARLREALSMNDREWSALANKARGEAKNYDWGKLGDAYSTVLLQAVEEARSGLLASRGQFTGAPRAAHGLPSGHRAA